MSPGAATYYEEQGQLIRGGRSIAALGPNLLGDKVNLYTGATEFIQTDVSLLGNDALPMAVVRRLSSAVAAQDVSGLFGRWDLDLPRCRVPCDHVPVRSWTLFKAKDLMRELFLNLKAEPRLASFPA